MKQLWHRADILDGEPVPIVADGAVATTAVGEGRLILVLILDTSKRPDIEDLVKAQARLPAGDGKSQWGRPYRSKSEIALVLRFERPINALVILEFNVADQGILIEQILKAKSLYLQPGRKGDRLTSTLENPRMLVEVPELGFSEEWKKIWPKEVAKKFRKLGLKRRDARAAAEKVISDIQEFSGFRMRRR